MQSHARKDIAWVCSSVCYYNISWQQCYINHVSAVVQTVYQLSTWLRATITKMSENQCNPRLRAACKGGGAYSFIARGCAGVSAILVCK